MLTYIEGVSLDDLRSWLKRYTDEGAQEPVVLQLRDKIISESMDKSDLCAVFDYVKDRWAYGPDPEWSELFIHPRITAAEGLEGNFRSMDCDDSAMLIAALVRTIGDQSRVVLLDTDHNSEIDHAIAEVWLESAIPNTKPLGWTALDPSSKGLPLGWYIRSSARLIA